MTPREARNIFERLYERESRFYKNEVRYPATSYSSRWIEVNFEKVLSIRFLWEARMIRIVSWDKIRQYAGLPQSRRSLRLAYATKYRDVFLKQNLPDYKQLLEHRDTIEYIFSLTQDESKGRVLFQKPALLYPKGLVINERQRGLPLAPEQLVFAGQPYKLPDDPPPDTERTTPPPLFVKPRASEEVVDRRRGQKPLFVPISSEREHEGYSEEALEFIRIAKESENL